MRLPTSRSTLFAGLAAILVSAAAFADPASNSGPVRERDEAAEQLRQEQLERAEREWLERDQAARDTGRRLDTLKQQQRLPLPPPGAPDRPTEMMRGEALRQHQQEYDRALQQRDAAEQAVRDAGRRAAPRRPIGADAR